MCWSSRGLPGLFLAPFNALSEVKNAIEDKLTFCAGSQSNSFTWFRASSSVVRLQAVGGLLQQVLLLSVVLQRYRSCGSWACPGGLVSGWTWCWGRIWGCLAGWT